jgi:hypothetical protein
MIRDVFLLGGAVLLAMPALLSSSVAFGQDGTTAGPVGRQPSGPPPTELRAEAASAPLPALRSAGDVRAFIDAASAAPVSRREEVRATIQRTRNIVDVAKGLIAEFEIAQKTDFSRALVILSLIGEQRSPAGTSYLVKFIRRPLPSGSRPTTESGVSPEAEALERLQVKAANALPYASTAQALQATLEVVRSHPLKPVRIEAASSYLWNTGNSEEARRTLSRFLRKDELLVLDRPVRDQGTTAEQFNRQLALYLDRHPEVRAPAPTRGPGAPSTGVQEPAGPPPPSESGR